MESMHLQITIRESLPKCCHEDPGAARAYARHQSQKPEHKERRNKRRREMPNSLNKTLLALSLAGIGATSCSLLEDYPQNPFIQKTSSDSYKKCDGLASDILQISYDRAGEKGGRFTNFITRSADGAAILYQLNDKREFEVISDDESVASAVYGSDFMGMLAISASHEASKNSGGSISKFIGDTILPKDNDPRQILETNASLVCKVKFMALGSEEPGFYRISEDDEGYYYEETE